MGELTFERIHWGDPPTHDVEAHVLVRTRARADDELAAVSYAASKGGQPAVFRHSFDRRRDRRERRLRGPYLLQADADGEFRLAGVAPRSLAIGLGVDVETRRGERVLLAECLLITDTRGRYCQFGFLSSSPWNLEQWGARMTEDGIDG